MKRIKNYEDFTNEEINLKKALAGAALGAGLAISNPVSSQLTRYSPSEPKQKIELSDYDSTTVHHPLFKNMIGQNFVIVEPSQTSSNYNDCKFYTSKLNLRRSNYYNSTHITDAFGREIKLLEVIVTDSLDSDKFFKGETEFISYILKFEDIKTKEILYYEYLRSFSIGVLRTDSELELTEPENLPFISTGYIEKLTSKLKNTPYNNFIETLLQTFDKFGYDKMLNLTSGQSTVLMGSVYIPDESKLREDLKFIENEIYNDFKFSEIVINEKSQKLAFKFTSQNNEKYVDIPNSFFTKFKIKK